MNFEEWKQDIPDTIKSDTLWKMSAYQYALFIGDLGWYDVTKLQQDPRTYRLSSQPYEALGSISANIAEDYSRGSNKERAHFYEYAPGSARESRDRYHRACHILGENVVEHRINLLIQVMRLLLTMIPEQRGRSLHEEQIEYKIGEEMNMDFLAKDALIS